MIQIKDFFVKNKFKILFGFLFINLSLFFVPNQERFYLKSDIENFKNDFYWKIIFISIIIILIYLTSKIIKEETKKITDILFAFGFVTLIILYFTFIFQNVIISLFLLSNKLIDRNQTKIVYEVKSRQNCYSKIISESKNDTIEKLSELDFFYKLEDVRLNQNLKSINKSDTIHIKYGIGLFGIKYLK